MVGTCFKSPNTVLRIRLGLRHIHQYAPSGARFARLVFGNLISGSFIEVD